MTNEDKSKIYDRLLSINVEISIGVIPDPGYINRKIGECHLFIDEVEKFYIAVSKEISTLQRALNTCRAKYEFEKESLLINNQEIRNLPSITDREAKANSYLKDTLKEIQNYENEVTDLNNLLRSINLKLKNLSRTNGDIKSLMKMVEAQIKIGSPITTDVVAKNFLEEMNRGLSDEDSFKNSESSVTETIIADPSEPLDVDKIISSTEPEKPLQTENTNINNLPEDSVEESENNPSIKDDSWTEDGFNNLSEEIIKEAEKSIQEEIIVDLDNILEDSNPVTTPEKKEGGEEAKNVVESKKGEEPEKKSTNTNTMKVDGVEIDFDSFLTQYTK